jgi:pyruvate formate lyase activating enzyme
MNIRGIYKTSLIDYPGKISAVIFSGGCNLRCRYCHNPSLVCGQAETRGSSNQEALEFIKKRRPVIDGVTLSGGEPTLNSGIKAFIESVKDLGLKVKLDTNGTNPKVIEALQGDSRPDFIALDIKTSPSKYSSLTGTQVDFSKISESIDIIRSRGIDYEIRTTCVPGYISVEDLSEIRDSIGPVKSYCLQQFIRDVPLIDDSLRRAVPYSRDTLNAMIEFIKGFSDHQELRGI